MPQMWATYNAMPNPSPESINQLRRIRAIEKTLRAVQATKERHGW